MYTVHQHFGFCVAVTKKESFYCGEELACMLPNTSCAFCAHRIEAPLNTMTNYTFMTHSSTRKDNKQR